jgi:hypothetical protein
MSLYTCRLLAAVVCCIALVPSVAIAQDSDAGPAAAGASRRHVFALAADLGHAVEIGDSVPTDTGGALLRWTRRSGARWLGGEPAFGVELTPYTVVDQEPRAHGGGASFLYEHRLLPESSVRPVLRLGLGALLTDYEVPTEASRTNATMFVGGGAEVGLGRASWLTIEYRFHHLTGVGSGERNPGIYTHRIALGYARAF